MGQTQSLNYQSLRLTQEQDRIDMAFAHFFFAFLAIGAVVAEEEFIEGLSADEILNTEFEVEYAADDRTIDEIIAAAGTAAGAAKAAGENQEINYDMDMNMDPMQYEVEYGKLAGFAGAGMASSWYRWPKAIIPYRIQSGYTQTQLNTIYQGMQMWMERPASNSCLTDPTRPDLPDTTTTSKSSAEAAATPASATTIVPTKCPSQPAAALSQESLPTNWVALSVFTTNNADLTVTTTSKSSLATFLAT